MLPFFLSCFAVATLSQTYLTLDGNKIIIKNVIIGANALRQDLVINPNSGKTFQIRGENYGKYTKNLGNTDLQFSIKPKYSLYQLQAHIQNKQVKYNDKQIQPTFSYMIAAHGYEYQQHQIVRRASYGFENGLNQLVPEGGEEKEVAPDTEQKIDWVGSKSSIYFFVKQWTLLDSHKGEGYTVLFDKGEFSDLKSKTVEVVQPGGKIGKQYWALYGPEFEVSSGVYRLKRNKDQWEEELVGPLPDTTKTNPVELFDIVKVLESEYGPGDIYWNACRKGKDPATISGTTGFMELFKRRTHHETEVWRKIMLTKMIKRWNAKWEEFKKEDKEGVMKLKNDYKNLWKKRDVDGSVNREIQRHEKLVEDAYKTKPNPEEFVHIYNGEHEIKIIQDRHNAFIAQRKKIVGAIEDRSIEDQDEHGSLVLSTEHGLTQKISKQEKKKMEENYDVKSGHNWFDKWSHHPNGDVGLINDGTEKQNVMVHDGGLSDIGAISEIITIGIVIDIVLILIYCVCFGCIIAGLIGFVTGYFVKDYIDNKPQQRGKDIREYNV